MFRRLPPTRGGGRSRFVRKLRSLSRLWSHVRCSDLLRQPPRGGRQGNLGKRGRAGDDHAPTSRLVGKRKGGRRPHTDLALFRKGGRNPHTNRPLRTLGLSGTSRAPLARFTTERGRGWERSVRKPSTHANGLSVSLGQTMRSRGCLGERRRLLARSALRQDGDV